MKFQEMRELVVNAAWNLLHHFTCCASIHSVENTLVTMFSHICLCRPVSRPCWMSSSSRKNERSSR